MDDIDWQTKKTLSQSTKYMLENSIKCDVNFKVGENQEVIKAHKFILTIRSAVFDRMFSGSYSESEKDPIIPDVSPAAFKTLLRYCYYDCLDIQDDEALSVLYASTKYMLPLLEEVARKKLIQILRSSKYIWDVYKYAVNVGDTELHDACRKYFQGDVTPVREALQAGAFLNIPHNVLLDFLHINDEVDKSLLIPENRTITPTQKANSGAERLVYQNCIGVSISEIDLFKSCNAWGEAECLHQKIDPTGTNKRNVLGKCLFLIRFPTMLQKDLVNVVYPTGILTQDEALSLLQYNHKETNVECQVDFACRERQFVVTVLGIKSNSDNSTVSIESDHRVMLSRVWTRYVGSYTVTVKNETSKRCWSQKYVTRYENQSSRSINATYKLYFIDIEPQLLEADTVYHVTTDVIQRSDELPRTNEFMKKIAITQLATFKELKLSHESGGDNIYALTVRLV